MEHHHHSGKPCACPHHHGASRSHRSGTWSALLPLLACAVCPACVATYAKVLSAVGVGIALSETQHLWLLLACLTLSLGFGLSELRTTRRFGPMLLTSAGGAVLVAVHLFGEDAGMGRLSWLGVALLLGGAVWGHRLRLAVRRAASLETLRGVERQGRRPNDGHAHAYDSGPAA